jgi:hypothetical protein
LPILRQQGPDVANIISKWIQVLELPDEGGLLGIRWQESSDLLPGPLDDPPQLGEGRVVRDPKTSADTLLTPAHRLRAAPTQPNTK